MDRSAVETGDYQHPHLFRGDSPPGGFSVRDVVWAEDVHATVFEGGGAFHSCSGKLGHLLIFGISSQLPTNDAVRKERRYDISGIHDVKSRSSQCSCCQMSPLMHAFTMVVREDGAGDGFLWR